MEITFTLSLPRDGQSVPLVRRITGDSLGVLGVEADCVSDIQVALSEACSNVLKHSGAEDDYEVNVVIRDRLATLEVLDRGAGFDAERVGLSDAAAASEGGRGIQLMRALVDQVSFTVRPEAGTVVHLEKELSFVPGSAMERFAGAP